VLGTTNTNACCSANATRLPIRGKVSSSTDARQLVARACAVSDNEVSTLVGQVGKRLWRPDQNQASALDRDGGGGASERPTESIHSPTSSSVTHSLAPYSRRRLAAISDSSAGLKVCLQAAARRSFSVSDSSNSAAAVKRSLDNFVKLVSRNGCHRQRSRFAVHSSVPGAVHLPAQ
jgi:hypothetical protein